jgi:hypothetical protein
LFHTRSQKLTSTQKKEIKLTTHVLSEFTEEHILMNRISGEIHE